MKSTLRSLIEQIAAFMPWIPDWVFAIAAFIGIVAAGLVLQSLINQVIKRRPADWRPFLRHAWRRTRRLVRFMLVLFALSVILPLLHPPHDLRDEIRRVFLALAVIKGLMGPVSIGGKTYNGVMPAQAGLDDASVAAVLNHVGTRIATTGPRFVPFTPAEVAAARASGAGLSAGAVAKLHPAGPGK